MYLNYHYPFLARRDLHPPRGSSATRVSDQFYRGNNYRGIFGCFFIFISRIDFSFFFFFLLIRERKRDERTDDRVDGSSGWRKTGCFAQPDTKNTINPALHVGVVRLPRYPQHENPATAKLRRRALSLSKVQVAFVSSLGLSPSFKTVTLPPYETLRPSIIHPWTIRESILRHRRKRD